MMSYVRVPFLSHDSSIVMLIPIELFHVGLMVLHLVDISVRTFSFVALYVS